MNMEHKVALERELENIVSELQTIATQDPQTKDWAAVPNTEELGNPDSNEEADAIEDWNERQALLAQLETQYRNTVRALEKLSAGTYGTCEICGNTIEGDRLAANLSARTCKAHLENEAELPL